MNTWLSPTLRRALMLLMVLWAFARAARADDSAVWGAQFLTVDASGDHEVGPQFWLDLHERHTSGGFVGIVRPGVGVKLPKGFSLWAGYAWNPTVDAEGMVSEHDAWEQLMYGTKVGVASLAGRLRFEERFKDGQTGMAGRARLFARAGFDAYKSLGIVVWDEAFFGLNEIGWAHPGFDQNRAFVGPFLNAAEGFRVEIGYMHQLLNRAGTLENVHVAVANLAITLHPKIAQRHAHANEPAAERPDDQGKTS